MDATKAREIADKQNETRFNNLKEMFYIQCRQKIEETTHKGGRSVYCYYPTFNDPNDHGGGPGAGEQRDKLEKDGFQVIQDKIPRRWGDQYCGHTVRW